MTPDTLSHAPDRPTASADGATLDAAESPPAPPDGAPAVPGYDLRGEVGRGGMGVVYRARDVALDREVAVKVLRDRYAPDSGTARRFVDEARITAQLQHPGIPAVYHVGALADSRPFLAMKLIKGDTLDDLLKGGAAVDPLAITEAIGQAVGYAHAHGVVHRDLKPADVMVGAFGEVQVMDWGLAKVLGGPAPADPEATAAPTEIRTLRESDGSVTQAGSVLGTPAYMPPEQAAGEVDRVDARSDVFGLGAHLCALLTGQPPYTGKDAESVRVAAVRGKTDEAFARLDASGADPGVVALCKRCLAFEPADRPATASAVAGEVAALRRAADDRARQAEHDKLAAEVRSAERRKRRRVATALAGLVFAAVLAGGTVAVVQWRRASAGEQAAAQALTELQAEQATTQALVVKLTDEQTRTKDALVREERAAAATRAGLLGWLRQRAAAGSQGSEGTAQNKRDAGAVARVRSLVRDSLAAMPAGRERMRAEAEFNVLLGRIVDGDEARSAYTTAVRLARELLATDPTSVPLRRLLADALYGAATTGGRRSYPDEELYASQQVAAAGRSGS